MECDWHNHLISNILTMQMGWYFLNWPICYFALLFTSREVKYEMQDYWLLWSVFWLLSNFYTEICHQCVNIRRWAAGKWLGHKGTVCMDGINALIKGGREQSCFLHNVRMHRGAIWTGNQALSRHLLLAPWSWTSQTLKLWEINVCCS
jgi:hypothetical protein